MRQHRHAPLPVTTLNRRAAMANRIEARTPTRIKPASECKRPRVDLTGHVFGKWTVIEFAGRSVAQNATYWACRCECGSTRNVCGPTLTRSESVSCGCTKAEIARKTFSRHSQYGTPEYFIWIGIKDRCYRTRNPGYKNYGGRGIQVCDRWKNSFDLFLSDMGPRPSRQHQIDRIDNDKDYCPENCRWATRRQQCNNKRTTHLLTVDGEAKSIAEWARETGISQGTIWRRISLGWQSSDAVKRPVKK